MNTQLLLMFMTGHNPLTHASMESSESKRACPPQKFRLSFERSNGRARTAYPLYIVVCERATVAVGLQPVVQVNLIQIRTHQFFTQLMRLSGNPFQPLLVMQSAEDRSANNLTIVR